MNEIPAEEKPAQQRSDLFLIATGKIFVGMGLLIPLATGLMLVFQVPALPDVFRAGPPVTILALGCGGLLLYIAAARMRARYREDRGGESVAPPATAWQCGCGVTNRGGKATCRACGTLRGGIWTPDAAKGPLGTVDRIRSRGILALGLCATLAAFWATSWHLGREQWGPFRGQIVDVETGQPIEGAAALAVWWVDIPMLVQSVESFYDAREAVTNAEGRFEVPGRWPAIFWLFIPKPGVMYFAPGYVIHDAVVPEGQSWAEHIVVEMRKLKTREELLKKNRGQPARVPKEKMVEFLGAIKVERKMLGLD